VSLARLLLEAGAEVDARYDGGSIALHVAAMTGDEELIRLLLRSGADRTVRNDDGDRPQDVARDEPTRALLASEA
jgi:uncharacterized protein